VGARLSKDSESAKSLGPTLPKKFTDPTSVQFAESSPNPHPTNPAQTTNTTTIGST
jgi:hypothetical protein